MISLKRVALMVLLVAGVSSLVPAAIVNQKDSADFTWKYEFTTDLPTVSDLDENTVGDFDVNGGGTLSGGVLTMSSTVYNYYACWGTGSRIWDVIDDLDLEHGVTVEMNVKVLAAAEGTYGATTLNVDPDGTNVDGNLHIGKTAQHWDKTTAMLGAETSYDNTGGFHAFRVALDPDTETFSVWRDNELLGSGLGDTDNRDNLRRLIFGDGQSSGLQGDVEIDYVRFTSGAHAPVPKIFFDHFPGDSLDTSSRWDTPMGDGLISVADSLVTLDSDSSSGNPIIDTQPEALDFSQGTGSWTAEIRFKLDALETVSNRQGILLQGSSDNFGGDTWEAIAIDLRLLEVDDNHFDLGWHGWDNTGTNRQAEVLTASALSLGEFYTVTALRRSDDTVDIFLDGLWLANKPLLVGAHADNLGQTLPDLFRIGDLAGTVAMNLSIDYVDIRAVPEPAGLLLLVMGLTGLGLRGRRRRRR